MRKVSSVRRLCGKTRCACIVLVLLLVSVLGAVSAPNSPSHGVVLSVAAQTPAASNATVYNNVSVLSDIISLGSTLRVEGTVTTPGGPLAFLPVALHMGDITVAHTQTNETGAYVFSVPVGLNYVPAVVYGGASVYTVTEPGNPAVLATTSAAVRLPVNAIPAYGIVVGLVIIAVLGLYVITRVTKRRFHVRQCLAALGQRLSGRTRGARNINLRSRLALTRQRLRGRTRGARNVNVKGRLEATREWFQSLTRATSHRQDASEKLSQSEPLPERGQPLGVGGNESTEELPSQVPTEEQLRLDRATLAAVEQTEAPPQPAPVRDTELALETARDLFDKGRNQPAVGVLYSATVTCLAKVHGVAFAPSMTQREKYAALQSAAPNVRAPLRTLTVVYERTTYGGKSLTKEQQNTVIEACRSICKLIGRADSQ